MKITQFGKEYIFEPKFKKDRKKLKTIAPSWFNISDPKATIQLEDKEEVVIKVGKQYRRLIGDKNIE